MDHPGIDPPDGDDGIRTIRGNPLANEKIFGDRLFHPPFKSPLFFKRPPAVAYVPDVIGRFIRCLAEARRGDEDEQKEGKNVHDSILRRRAKVCQQNG
jgi:hypothetical protein